MAGGRALAEMIRLHGAGPLFGMGGFQLLPFYEAARELGLRHYLINDERCGAFAADAWARVTGRPGICDGTLGPGATNLVTGLVESLNAGIPVIALTGDAHRLHAGKNMTQEARQLEILRPAVKEVLRIEHPARIPETVRRAFRVATSGRPGPVVVDVPEDIAHGVYDFPAADFRADGSATRVPAQRSAPARADLEAAAALLLQSSRPLILAGGGVHLSGAHEALRAFAELLAAPVAHTLSGKGSLACVHPLSVGLFGRYSRFANELIAKADCLVAIGCKLGEIATRRYDVVPADVPLVHIDILPEEFGRTTPVRLALQGDAEETLSRLSDALRAQAGGRLPARRPELEAEVGRLRAAWLEQARPRLTSSERPINVARLMAALNETVPADGILVADGGFAAHWSGLLYDTRQGGRTYIANRGFASIGYGLPGAIGAQLAAPDRAVVSLTGDAGLNMTLGELETAGRVGTPIVLVVINNAASGYVKALQHAMYGGRYQSSDLREMNYARIAEDMGCRGIRVTEPADLAGALRDAMAARERPTVVDVVVTRDPAQMLPAADSRAVQVRPGDRPA
ncbi:MAG TPA: thiamine pyrophosphate-binding protein [Thermodesulfobacteriota bacterium]